MPSGWPHVVRPRQKHHQRLLRMDTADNLRIVTIITASMVMHGGKYSIKAIAAIVIPIAVCSA
eukprot:10084847-Prorocentrum_lima.AAC.1